MTPETKAVATSLALWVIAIATVGIVVAQAILFRKRALIYTREHNVLTEDEIKAVTKNGAIATIGPALAVFIMAITVSSMLGGPFTLMRVGIIGSADTELRTATMAALLSGYTLGADAIPLAVFGTCFFTCAIMSVGYLIWVPIMTRGLGKGLQKFIMPDPNVEQTKAQKIISKLVMILPMFMIVYMIYMYASAGVVYAAVMFTSIIIKFIIDKVGRNKPTLKAWSLGLAVLGGMLSSILWSAIL